MKEENKNKNNLFLLISQVFLGFFGLIVGIIFFINFIKDSSNTAAEMTQKTYNVEMNTVLSNDLIESVHFIKRDKFFEEDKIEVETIDSLLILEEYEVDYIEGKELQLIHYTVGEGLKRREKYLLTIPKAQKKDVSTDYGKEIGKTLEFIDLPNEDLKIIGELY